MTDDSVARASKSTCSGLGVAIGESGSNPEIARPVAAYPDVIMYLRISSLAFHVPSILSLLIPLHLYYEFTVRHSKMKGRDLRYIGTE